PECERNWRPRASRRGKVYWPKGFSFAAPASPAAARPAHGSPTHTLASFSTRDRVSGRSVARDGRVVGGERGREFVAAVAAGDEVEVVDGGGVDGGLER